NVWSEEGGDASAFADWRTGNGGGRADFDESEIGLDQTLSREVSLRDHLLAQLNVEVTDPVDRIIATHLIDMLDEAGYMTGELPPSAEWLKCEVAQVERPLDNRQLLARPGVFARSLKECLGLQLRERNRLDPAMQALLDHLDLLARRDIVAITRICG